MSALLAITIAILAGAALSIAIAAVLVFSARPTMVPTLVSYAIGALLGAVFLEILPHAFEVSAGNVEYLTAVILLGILLFFVLEKLVIWRHCHGDACEAHGVTPAHDHGRSGLMILVGNTLHNLVDGVLIAAAFVADFQLGVVTSLAIIAHEIPQEAGDFVILLHSGYGRARALWLNAFASLATLVGGIVGYFALSVMQQWVPTLLGLAAASMIYVAVADLIPGLHKRTELAATASQVLLIGLGVLTIWGAGKALGTH